MGPIQTSEILATEVGTLEIKLLDYLNTSNKPINDIITHVFSSGGKRIRPTLFFLCAQLIGYEGEHKYPIAAVCEYIHTASLLHDDVIDNSTLRRNKPTVNSIWGDETAVLAGDLIYSTACRLMVKTKNLELIDTFAECIRSMSECELFQLEMLWNERIQESEYDHLVLGKTARLFEAATKTPGLLHNLPEESVLLLADFGRNLGIAFQIADDCLDYTASQETAGKPIVADIFEGKVTLPLIYGMQSRNPELIDIITKVVETGSLTDYEKNQLRCLLIETRGIQLAKERAQKHIFAAFQALEAVCSKISTDCTQDKIFLHLKQMALQFIPIS